MSDNKSLDQAQLRETAATSNLTDAQMDIVAGGVSLNYEKVQVTYTPQRVSTASNKTGDPDEGGQFRLR